MRRLNFVAAATMLTLLAGCSRERPAPAAAAAARDAETIDPALTSALADQIMVDPGLVQQANNHSARMPPAPLELQIPAGAAPGDDPLQGAGAPATLGQLADSAAAGSYCRPMLDYSAAWANKLPVQAPLYPDARVQAAAGDAHPGCGFRVVSFSSGDPPAKLIAFYRDAAAKAGWSVRVERGVVAARRADGSAVRVAVALRQDGGSDVDLIAAGG